MQALRARRRPVSAARLATELGVSPRTIYRDVATLVAEGAVIEGEAGVGYVLKPGFFLPPLMFSEDELDALVLGLALVEQRGDADLGTAARDAMAKIAAVLPPALAEAPASSGLLARPGDAAGGPYLRLIRQALRAEEKLHLAYTDKRAATTERIVWPVALGFFETAEVLAAWCETRRDFRHFRLDRIARATRLSQRCPTPRRILLAQWRAAQEVDEFR